MERLWIIRRGWRLWPAALIALLVIALAVLLGAPAPLAQGPGSQPVQAIPPDYTGPRDADDGPAGGLSIASEWPLEVGVEWVGDYPGTDGDLLGADDYAYALYNRLKASGWCNFAGNDCYIWGNGNAWEEDFKRHDLGGTNDNWVDDVDLTFYIGHGNSGLFTFLGFHDDQHLTYNDARLAWGNNDLEWMSLLSCQVLADTHELDWVWTMDGLHLLLGFETNAWLWHYPTASNNFGDLYAKYITWNYTIPNAWFKACDQAMLTGMRAKVLAEEYHHFYDTKSYQYPDSWDYDYYRWEHKCGCEPARPVDLAQLGRTMPIFETPPLDLEGEALPMWGNLSSAFQVPTQTLSLAQDDNQWVSTVDGRELEMDPESGLFYYIDHNNLFSPTVSSAVQLLTAEDAHAIADQFLTSNGLMPADAQFYEVVAETVEGLTLPNRGSATAIGPAELMEQTLVGYQVIYSRIMTYTTALHQEPTEFSVMGPSGKMKVYVAPTGGQAQVAANGGPGAVVGAMGGWRRVQEQSAPGLQQAVVILPYEQVELLFQQLEPQVAYANIPFDNPTHKEVLTYTLGYWEESTGVGQDELYPAYIMLARYESNTGLQETYVVTDYTYLPANETYARPFARIESHSDLSSDIMPGQVLTFTASDASLPLNQLGYHASLSFVLGSGVGPYLYDWYLDSLDNHIGSGRTISYTVAAPGGSAHAGPVAQHVILVVTDFGSLHTSLNANSDSVSLTVVPPVYVPTVLKNHQ